MTSNNIVISSLTNTIVHNILPSDAFGRNTSVVQSFLLTKTDIYFPSYAIYIYTATLM